MRKLCCLLITMLIFIAGCKKEPSDPKPQISVLSILPDETTADFNSVFFTDKNTGYAVGTISGRKSYEDDLVDTGLVYKTEDAGITWKLIFKASGSLKSTYFTDANTGFVAGDNRISYELSNSAVILKTNNAGKSWSYSTLPANYGIILSSIYFTDANTGFAVGGGTRTPYSDSTIFFKTTNAGSTWTALNGPRHIYFTSLYFTDSNNGFATGWNEVGGGVIYKTTDSGKSWTEKAVPEMPQQYYLNSICFPGANTGKIMGASNNGKGGVILGTKDAGETWTTSFVKLPVEINTVYYTSDKKGFAGGDAGIILETSDEGLTWSELNTGSAFNVTNSIHFPDATTGYAVGNNGLCIKISI